ncbi:c-type cytochrome [Rhabdothermincola salaria]|uniref:c-type cytochrome n=1 Tax=Rhabdothermincola salaria TaxID=2903142 RepID=UPI001E48C30A|nr:c-type cytochrome [Rhabdothermincola salaria]MCD9625750.1 cytochrome c [Rhabdothermincola salaria]
MSNLLATVVLANTQRTIGIIVAIVLIVGFGIGVIVNMRKGRAEVGSELELAANRRPYMDDEELETKKLDRTLGLGLATLAVIGVTLPLYWLAEPGRQEDAVANFEEVFVSRGEDLYVNGAQCASCHGPEGVGGVANFTLTGDNGDFIASVSWKAPSLDDVLFRYTAEEVKSILIYGRAFSPMPAWGAEGGGPLTDQQLDNIVDYLFSIQLSAEEARAAVDEQIETVCAPDADGNCTTNDPASPGGSVRYETLGEAIFNLGLYDGFAGGSYSCGRCHTKGWSYGEPQVPGGGAMGPNLTGGSTLRQFPTAQSQIDFVTNYQPFGTAYGQFGLSEGAMPGFGANPNAIDPETARLSPDQVMLTQEQIAAVVEYERSL